MIILVAFFVVMHLEFCTYVLVSRRDGDFYIGFSSDLKKRLTDHNNGKVISTRNRRPLELIYFESHRNKYDALRRDKYLKTTAGKKALRLMIRESLVEFKNCDV